MQTLRCKFGVRAIPSLTTMVPRGAFFHVIGVLLAVFLAEAGRSTPLQQAQRQLSVGLAVQVDSDTHVDGGADSSVQIDCKGLQAAFVVRQGVTLRLEGVHLTGCRGHAIELEAGARLTAVNVTLTGHQQPTPVASSSLGAVLYAPSSASITLEHVRLEHNSIVSSDDVLTAAKAEWQHVAGCEKEGPAGSATLPWSCGAPKVSSSLIHLGPGSSLEALNSSISHNAAAAVLTADGSAALRLHGCQVRNNKAAWLVVADAWKSDEQGRQLMRAKGPASHDAAVPQLRLPPHSRCELMRQFPWLAAQDARLKRSRCASNVTVEAAWELPAGISSPPAALLALGVPNKDAATFQMVDSNVSHNAVTYGLLWMRLFKSSITGSTLQHNLATGLPSRQQQQLVTDMLALQMSLVVFHGPVTFQLHWCELVNNTHPQGALIHVTHSLASTSLHRTTMVGNTATALLLFVGYGVVRDAHAFFQAAEYTEILGFANFKMRQQVAYTRQQEMLAAMEEQLHSSVVCAVWSMHACLLHNNTVFLGVLVSAGNQTTYRQWSNSKGKQAGLSTDDAMLWLSDNVMTANSFQHDSWLEAAAAALDSRDGNSVAALASILLQPSAALVAACAPAAGALRSSNGSSAQAAVCWASLAEAVYNWRDAASSGAQPQPAVLWARHSRAFLVNNTFRGNTRFAHMISADSVRFSLLHNKFLSNVMEESVLAHTSSQVFVQACEFSGNTAPSVIKMQDVRAFFHHVNLTHNNAPPQQLESLNKRICNTPTNNGSSPSQPPPLRELQALVSIKGLNRGSLTRITAADNAGPFSVALELCQFFVEAPKSSIQHLVVRNNTAGGVWLRDFQPQYEQAELRLTDVNITCNRHPASSKVAGLTIDPFRSSFVSNMSVSLSRLTLTNNRPFTCPGRTEIPPWQLYKLSQVRGGGLSLPSPDDTTSPSMLAIVLLSIEDSTIAANVAAEGGGVASGWPMQILRCTITDNVAVNGAGGGLLLEGLQQNKLGSTVITNSTIHNNQAAFGGGIACSNCRAVLINTALTDNSATDPTPPSCEPPHAPASATPALPTTLRTIPGIVPGAGGGIAANMQGNSFLFLLCNSSISGSQATWVGAAAYLNYTGLACGPAMVTAPPLAASGLGDGSFCPVAAALPLACGISASHDVRWDVTTVAPAKGALLARTGSRCFLNSSCGSVARFATLRGLLRRLCDRQQHCQRSLLLYELPSQLRVFYRPDPCRSAPAERSADPSGCKMQPLNGSISVRGGGSITLSVQLDVETEQLFSQALHRGAGAAKARCLPLLSGLEVHQNEALHLMGPEVAQMMTRFDYSNGRFEIRALLPNLTLETAQAPLRNVQAYFVLQPYNHHGLLRQVQRIEVAVEVLKCTSGQFELNNQCVECAGTDIFSLNAQNTAKACMPCPSKEASQCTDGLLVPNDDFFMPSPFWPFIASCPLQAACRGPDASTTGGSGAVAWHRQLLGREADGAFARCQQQGLPPDDTDISKDSRELLLSTHDCICQKNDTRSKCLLRFQHWLASAITASRSPTPRAPLVSAKNYCKMLELWQRLQCSPGYTGRFCGTCEQHYSLVLQKCVACMSPAAIWAAVAAFVVATCFVACCVTAMQHGESAKKLRQWRSEHPATCLAADAGAGCWLQSDYIRPCAKSVGRFAWQWPGRVLVYLLIWLVIGLAWFVIVFVVLVVRAVVFGVRTVKNVVEACSEAGCKCCCRHLSHVPWPVGALFTSIAENIRERVAPARRAEAAANPHVAVAIWKGLTSYLQTLMMIDVLQITDKTIIEYLKIRGVYRALALDCVLSNTLSPGTKAMVRVVLRAVGMPAMMLLVTAATGLVIFWLKRTRPGESTLDQAKKANNFYSQVVHRTNSRTHQVVHGMVERGTSLLEVVAQTTNASYLGYPIRVLQRLVSKPLSPTSSREQPAAAASTMAAAVAVAESSAPTAAAAAAAGTGPPACHSHGSNPRTSGIQGQRWPELQKHLRLHLAVSCLVVLHIIYPSTLQQLLSVLECQPFSVPEQGPQRAEELEASLQWLVGAKGEDCKEHNTSGWHFFKYTTNGWFFAQDHGYECYNTPPHLWMTVSAIMLLAVLLLLPVAGAYHFWLLYKKDQQLQQEEQHQRGQGGAKPWTSLQTWDAKHNFAFSFLYEEFRPEYCFWEFIVLLRKFCFLLVLLLIKLDKYGSSSSIRLLQLQALAILSITFLVLHMRAKPYKPLCADPPPSAKRSKLQERGGVLNSLEQYALAVLSITWCLLGMVVACKDREVQSHAAMVVLWTLVVLLNAFMVLLYTTAMVAHAAAAWQNLQKQQQKPSWPQQRH